MSDKHKPVAIVLGGTFPHAELLRKLKKRGYYTILIDYFDNPPAACEADEHSTASALDFEAVLEVARARDAQLVMSSCLDKQLVVAMQVSEALGLAHPISSELALKATNKRYMKQIMVDHGIPTARYCSFSGEDEVELVELDYPVMVKPADNSGSAGVFKVESPCDLAQAVEKALKWSRSGEVVVEEYKRGMEVSVYAYVGDGSAQIISTAQRISVIEGDVTRCYSTVSPSRLSSGIREKLDAICLQIAHAFGFRNTPLFFQVIVHGDDVHVLELSPRLGGGLSYRVMQLNVGYDLMDASIDSYLGIRHAGVPQSEKGCFLIHLLYGKCGVFDHIEGERILLETGVITELHLMKTSGMEIGDEKASSARSAVMLIEGATEEECLAKLDKAISRLEIRDSDGKPLLDRSLWLTKEKLEESRNASSKA